MTNTKKPRRQRDAAPKPPASTKAAPEPVNETDSAETLVTTLSRQLAFTRGAFSALVQRYSANKVEQQQMNWDQGTELVRAELAALEQQLARIDEQTRAEIAGTRRVS